MQTCLLFIYCLLTCLFILFFSFFLTLCIFCSRFIKRSNQAITITIMLFVGHPKQQAQHTICNHKSYLRRVGPAVECRTRDYDIGQVPGSIPCRCDCSLCPRARHFTLHCFSRPSRKWVPVRADL